MPSGADFDFQFGKSQSNASHVPRDGDRPLRILIMGDFSGRGHRGLVAESDELARRPVVAVDIDNFDQVFARFAPTVNLPASCDSAASTVVNFQDLDDFHPDRLFERLDLFHSLRDLRRRLLDPATFEEAAAKLRTTSADEASEDSTAQPPQETTTGSESDGQTLSRLLGETPTQSSATTPRETTVGVDLSALIRDIVQSHIVPSAAPDQAQLVQSVDLAISAEMRRVLHDPSFQAAESIWRGVHWLLAELELGPDLQLHLMDVTKTELLHDVDAAADGVTLKGVYQRVVDQEVSLAGGQPWSVIVGHYSFAAGEKDCQLLSALGHLASQAGGPFLAAASASLLGCESIAASPDPTAWKTPCDASTDSWRTLRQSPVAPWLGLALPRVLLRLPYGQKTDELERFCFEELSAAQEHENYLWGNPALACALLIGKSFQAQGWSMEPGDDLELGDLPAHSYESDGESQLQPCAEVCLTELAADSIMGHGVMTLMSYKNRNAVRLIRFQSLADLAQTLAGPWR